VRGMFMIMSFPPPAAARQLLKVLIIHLTIIPAASSAFAYPYPFLNPSVDWNERATDLISRISLQTKVNLLQTANAPGIPGSGIPADPGYIVLPNYTMETYTSTPCLHGLFGPINMTVGLPLSSPAPQSRLCCCCPPPRCCYSISLVSPAACPLLCLFPRRRSALAAAARAYRVPAADAASAKLTVAYSFWQVFPQSITLAASFNSSLLHAVGSGIAEEARAVRNGFQQLSNKTLSPPAVTCLTPNINIARDPRCWG
jgi:hypothetical protein